MFSTIDEVVQLFPCSLDQIDKCIEDSIVLVRKSLNTLTTTKDNERTFANTAQVFDEAMQQFCTALHIFETVQMTHQDKIMRNAAQEAIITLNEFEIDVFMHRDVYKAFKAYYDKSDNESLPVEYRYYLDKKMRDFKRNGFELSDKDFSAVKVLKKEIARVGQEFNAAIASDSSSINVLPSQLDGVASDFINNLKRNSDETVTLKCDYPTISEVLGHCHDADVRKRLLHAFQNRAYPENVKRLHLIIAKRDELATLLGYQSYAHFDIADQMAKTPEQVESFLKDLIARASVKGRKEFSMLTKDLPPSVTLTHDEKFEQSDFKYVKESYKKKHFSVDARKVAEYFPVEKTIKGIFSIYEKFLGLDFECVQVDGFWHDDVRCIIVRNKSENQLRGYIFLDLFPREGKYSHARIKPVVPTLRKEDGTISPAICSLIANFPKATSEKPALLKHDDVLTFFHEFGHAMHEVLGSTTMAEFAGINVKWDFLEMPSQMFEKWMWDKDMLRQVSSHYKTGQSMPDKLIEKYEKFKFFGTSYSVHRKIFLSMLALNYFKHGRHKDTNAIYRDLHTSLIPNFNYDLTDHTQASFLHLVEYGSKYYSYLWSEVFALDLFEHVKKYGLFNKEIGAKFAQDVLGKGGSVPPDKLLKDFLGREPNREEFLRNLEL